MRLGIIELFYRTMTGMGGRYLARFCPQTFECSSAFGSVHLHLHLQLPSYGIRAESGSKWSTDAVGSALDQLGWPLFVSFRITWHWQNNGADSSQVAKRQLSGAPHFHYHPWKPSPSSLNSFISSEILAFSLGDNFLLLPLLLLN